MGCKQGTEPPAGKESAESPRPATPEPVAATGRAAAEAAIARLTRQLTTPAGDPESPWALAHGLLAFGPEFKTRDGRSAVQVAASFAQPNDEHPPRYGFPPEQSGKPVEPHPHLIVKTFLEIGLSPALELRASDGAGISVRSLLNDMRARMHEPESDSDWYDAAWWISALELDPEHDDRLLAPVRDAALARLEADDAVLASDAPDPFAPTAPMGAAKRSKSHIYGHPCGGLHFVQAILRAASASASPDFRGRTQRQLALLLRRHTAERELYAQTLQAHPEARLIVSGQQLKFFGHLLETLALAVRLGTAGGDPKLTAELGAAQRLAVADLLGALMQLEQERAYERLSEIAAQRRQLALDLIGDGCHAVHGLRETLPSLR
jgi:hypothetical protein